jgi:hypothetical protein
MKGIKDTRTKALELQRKQTIKRVLNAAFVAALFFVAGALLAALIGF